MLFQKKSLDVKPLITRKEFSWKIIKKYMEICLTQNQLH